MPSMAEQCISSADALEIVGGHRPGFDDRRLLVNGALDGKIGAHAMLYYEFDRLEQLVVERYDCAIPRTFWNFDKGDLAKRD